MPRKGLGPGTAIWKAGPGPYSHFEHLERCARLPRSEWTKRDETAWQLEEFREKYAVSLMKQVARGNVKAMDHYARLTGEAGFKPGAAVQVNLNQQQNTFRFVVEEVRSGTTHIPSLRPAMALPAAPMPTIVEAECVEVAESADR